MLPAGSEHDLLVVAFHSLAARLVLASARHAGACSVDCRGRARAGCRLHTVALDCAREIDMLSSSSGYQTEAALLKCAGPEGG